MKLAESVRIAWRAITGHKLRSTLTTLGIVIGVGSVIAFMVLGGGFQEDVLGDVEGENEPVLLVQTESAGEDEFGPMSAQDPIYTESDVEAIRNLDGVEAVGVGGSVPASQLRHGGNATVAFSVEPATAPALERGSAGDFRSGGPFEGDDEVVVSEGVAATLGHDVDVGDEVEIGFADGTRRTFVVAGVVEPTAGAPGQGPTVYVPADPYYPITVETPRGTEERAYTSLTVYTESVQGVDEVQASVEEHFSSGESDAEQLKRPEQEIQVQTIDELLDQIGDILDQITVFVAGVAAISLVVGSIGIANIMIVSVTERTREIGIMKAVGGRRRDVVQLFLVESVILGAVGALLGVLVGLAGGYLLTSILEFPMVYPWDWVAIAVAVGVGVGVLSGLYPAWRAARVDPIEALRRE